MPLDQEQRFAALAERIVSSDANPTEESLEKQILLYADNEDFNGEQIRRLSEAVNQLMFNKVLTSDSNKFDKTMSFPIVDPGNVIRRHYTDSDSKPLGKVASVVSKKLSDFYSDPKTVLYTKHEKTASADKESVAWTNSVKRDPHADKYEAYLLLKKAHEKLGSEMARCEFTILDSIDKLASMMLDPTGPEHAKFEKCSYLLYGKDSVPFLNMLRGQLDMPAITGFSGAMEKVGHIIIDDRKTEYNLIKESIDCAKIYVRCEAKRAEIDKTLKESGRA